MKARAILVLALLPAALRAAAPLPAWWQGLVHARGLEARFVQESDSAVFGKLRRAGTLRVAPGGRLRVAYEKGLLLVADGARLVQYDPDTRTAQGLALDRARAEAPLLNLLVAPDKLQGSYTLEVAGPSEVRLKPKRSGLPAVTVEGQGSLPRVIRWTDGTGAVQRLELVDAKAAPQDPKLFRFEAPAGTRWTGTN